MIENKFSVMKKMFLDGLLKTIIIYRKILEKNDIDDSLIVIYHLKEVLESYYLTLYSENKAFKDLLNT